MYAFLFFIYLFLISDVVHKRSVFIYLFIYFVFSDIQIKLCSISLLYWRVWFHWGGTEYNL